MSGVRGQKTVDRQQEVKPPLVTANACRRQSQYIQTPLFGLYLGMCVTKVCYQGVLPRCVTEVRYQGVLPRVRLWLIMAIVKLGEPHTTVRLADVDAPQSSPNANRENLPPHDTRDRHHSLAGIPAVQIE